jgi:hypothetical protein
MRGESDQGLYNKTLRTRVLRQMNRVCSKLVCFILSVTNTLGYYEIRDVFTVQAPESCFTKLFTRVNNSEVIVTYTFACNAGANSGGTPL